MADSAAQRQGIIDAMETLGVSVSELSRLSGVHRSTISRVLSAEPKHLPNTRTLDLLASALSELAGARPPWGHSAEAAGDVLRSMASAAFELSEDATEDEKTLLALYRSVLILLEVAIAKHVGLTDEEKSRLFRREGLDPHTRTKIGRALGLLSDDETARIHTIRLIVHGVAASGAAAGKDPSWLGSLREIADSEQLRALEAHQEPGQRLALALSVVTDQCAALISSMSARIGYGRENPSDERRKSVA